MTAWRYGVRRKRMWTRHLRGWRVVCLSCEQMGAVATEADEPEARIVTMEKGAGAAINVVAPRMSSTGRKRPAKPASMRPAAVDAQSAGVWGSQRGCAHGAASRTARADTSTARAGWPWRSRSGCTGSRSPRLRGGRKEAVAAKRRSGGSAGRGSLILSPDAEPNEDYEDYAPSPSYLRPQHNHTD